MAGTGLHPEGHKFRPIKDERSRYRFICENCAEVVVRVEDASDECIDDS